MTTDQRAYNARRMLTIRRPSGATWHTMYPADRADLITDAIADLMHLAAREGIDPWRLYDLAGVHYRAEVHYHAAVDHANKEGAA